ncbi:MAG: hypothetical protein RQ936_06995 [Gammaproteobacteria bacterium]|nr:hypothetical protein [Gammaproteobacteria bacterium]
MSNATDNMNVANIDDAIKMLNKYTNEPSIKPLISVLEALKEDLDNALLLEQLTDTWRNLGIYQGTVLTYVPYFYTLIPDDIFGDDLK